MVIATSNSGAPADRRGFICVESVSLARSLGVADRTRDAASSPRNPRIAPEITRTSALVAPLRRSWGFSDRQIHKTSERIEKGATEG
jgi:hypothetical protein